MRPRNPQPHPQPGTELGRSAGRISGRGGPIVGPLAAGVVLFWFLTGTTPDQIGTGTPTPPPTAGTIRVYGATDAECRDLETEWATPCAVHERARIADLISQIDSGRPVVRAALRGGRWQVAAARVVAEHLVTDATSEAATSDPATSAAGTSGVER